RVAEHPLRVQGEDERHADCDGADQHRQGVRGGQRPGAEDAQRHQRRPVPRFAGLIHIAGAARSTVCCSARSAVSGSAVGWACCSSTGTRRPGRRGPHRPGKRRTASSGWRCGCSIPASARSCVPCCRGSIPTTSPPSARAMPASWPPRVWPAWTGLLGALIRPAELSAAGFAAALAGLPPPWWLHPDLDVLATGELAAVDSPQPGGLTWDQLTALTATALAADGCAGWSICIYNPDLDPGRDGADAIISYITQAITASDQPARCSAAPLATVLA